MNNPTVQSLGLPLALVTTAATGFTARSPVCPAGVLEAGDSVKTPDSLTREYGYAIQDEILKPSQRAAYGTA